VTTATHHNDKWMAILQLPDLESALTSAAEGIPSDITIGGESVPATIDKHEAQIPISSFLVTGAVSAWRQVIDQERADALPLSQAPAIPNNPWHADRISFPVTSID
jgi:hypothetical protein